MMKPGALDTSDESLGDWLRRHRQTEGAMNRFWRLVIASALNADVDNIAVHYAAKVIRELFMNSAEAGSMGMSSVPLSELYAGAQQFLEQRGSSVSVQYQRGRAHVGRRDESMDDPDAVRLVDGRFRGYCVAV